MLLAGVTWFSLEFFGGFEVEVNIGSTLTYVKTNTKKILRQAFSY